MQPKTEEFLNLMLWSMDRLTHPTFRNLTGSYESWAYRNGFMRQLAKLEKGRLLERGATSSRDRSYRLTAEGRLHALGGRDPDARWKRAWDGQWRLVLFDIPTVQNAQRASLRRYLRDHSFGFIQNSVWITPDPLEKESRLLGGGTINVESLILLEARPCAGESDSDIVAGAWDFAGVNRRYARHIKILDERPEGGLRNEGAAKSLMKWGAAERKAWLEAVSIDPLLPDRILPANYLGQKAWLRRMDVLSSAAEQIATYSTV